MIKKKILAIVYRVRNNKEEFLVLKKNIDDKIHEPAGFYVVTGGVENDEGLLATVKREIKEETGIENIVDILDLNKMYEYKHPAEGDCLCQEYCFAVRVDDEVKSLSEEHTEYNWLSRKGFIETMFWYTDKNELKELLNKFTKQKTG